MYFIGEVKDKKLATRIGAALQSKNILCEITFEKEIGIYVIWVNYKEDVNAAQDLFRVSLSVPKSFSLDPEWKYIQSLPGGKLTKILIIFSLVIFICLQLKISQSFIEALFFSRSTDSFIPEILKGEMWRFWTPIFLHFGFLHFIFNMLWLKDLGKLIEYHSGTTFFLIFILFTAPISNFAQYFITGPSFGGMSGVIYGLLGLLWMKKKFDPSTKLSIPKSDVILMIGWFILCATGVIGSIANMAHALGLTIGMIFGIVMGIKSNPAKISKKSVLGYTFLSVFFSLITLAIEVLKIYYKYTTIL